ncbi:hypothetical protein B0T26DRAFT_680002 [Lasiosphaeria miniovina]|uniref:C2H2-type domain-containing protein n=1 Tax=Lasiosphaeria miniovina TaxID=1954250 RepID=A0AA40DMJ0_9PEZI|nr:uncharacterized protein B0T26DRAFT_680002 [Lasiosphaeria miniovina]KAK0706297.1 hypothetical protein B0T26DRAFT_680002 [Lasiosphaeria miniovina]
MSSLGDNKTQDVAKQTERWQCLFCLKSFTFRGGLTRHNENDHFSKGTFDRPFPCGECGRQGKTHVVDGAEQWSNHVETCHGHRRNLRDPYRESILLSLPLRDEGLSRVGGPRWPISEIPNHGAQARIGLRISYLATLFLVTPKRYIALTVVGEDSSRLGNWHRQRCGESFSLTESGLLVGLERWFGRIVAMATALLRHLDAA